MPELSRFLGIIIRMFAKDHPPPHFHAKYGDSKCSMDINTGELIIGEMPKNQLKQIKKWAKLHEEELVANWEESQKGNPQFTKIAPLK